MIQYLDFLENKGGGENPAIKYSTVPKVIFNTTYVNLFQFYIEYVIYCK